MVNMREVIEDKRPSTDFDNGGVRETGYLVRVQWAPGFRDRQEGEG